MGYKKKKVIALDTDSALAVMQEIYNDIVEQKNIASQITKKMLVFMKEAEDMTMIGSVIDKQQKILQDCTEKKISLVKLQSGLIKQTGSGGESGLNSSGKMVLSAQDRKTLKDLVDDKDEDKGDGDNGEKYTSK